MSSEITYRLYREGDEVQLVPLLDRVFVKWPHLDVECGPDEFWRWKYLSNPRKEMVHTVALDGDKVVGVCHAQPLMIRISGSDHLCMTNVDLAVEPEYRQRGVMTGIGNTRDKLVPSQGFQFSYNVMGNPILIKHHEKVRDRFPFPIVNLVRIKDIDLQLEKMPVEAPLIKKAGFVTLKAFNRIQSSLGSHSVDGTDVRLRVVERFGGEIDSFWEAIAPSYEFIVERRKEYLNWKYCDPRVGGFRVVYAEDAGGKVLGYCVSRVNAFREDYPVGFIVDVHALPGYDGVVGVLAADAVKSFDAAGVNIINCQLVKGHPYVAVLERLGFLDSRVEFHMFYILYSPEVLDRVAESTPDRIYVSWGDHDVLPVKMPAYKK